VLVSGFRRFTADSVPFGQRAVLTVVSKGKGSLRNRIVAS